MVPRVKIVGQHPFAKDGQGKVISRIATVFPEGRTLVTLPGIHATQRIAYVEAINASRRQRGLDPLSREEELAAWEDAVDLIIEDETILIRPDPDNMPLAFLADELLQELFSKHRIQFLYTLNEKVRTAIKRRGECWRITPLPRQPHEMEHLIRTARIGIGGREIYLYNRSSGTRWLTFASFASLDLLDDAELRQHLVEIQQYAAKINPRKGPEVAFYPSGSLTAGDMAAFDFAALAPGDLRRAFDDLRQRFRAGVPPELLHDAPEDPQWRNRICAVLIGRDEEVVSEEMLLGLSPEFFLQVEWLPGGRIEQGELIFDSVLEEEPLVDDDLGYSFIDDKPRKFIFNFVRQYGNLEYVNIGRVVSSLARRRPFPGRRDVYVVQVKQRDSDREIISVIRMQKWGVRERLDEGKSLLQAMRESEEYTEYVLDRRLGCRQLGMNLPSRVTDGRINERYSGNQRDLEGLMIWSPYFERDYIHGVATDKVPLHRFQNEEFALAFARLLGRAAAVNLVVGRCDHQDNVLFDDGDEVLVEDAAGIPVEIVVADQTGTFKDYQRDLRFLAPAYADAINRRAEHVSNLEAFATTYLDAFADRLAAIQRYYRWRRRAFDTLFKDRPRDERGSFAFRWEQVLARLDRSDPQELKDLIRENLAVFA